MRVMNGIWSLLIQSIETKNRERKEINFELFERDRDE
jgi:hypothetical protein